MVRDMVCGPLWMMVGVVRSRSGLACRRARGSAGDSAGLDDLKLDRAVVEGLLADRMALFSRFQFCLLNRVHLHEAVELPGVAPRTPEVVVAGLAGGRVHDERVHPPGQP